MGKRIINNNWENLRNPYGLKNDPSVALPDWAQNPQYEGPGEVPDKGAWDFGGDIPASRLTGADDPRNIGEYYAYKGDPRYDALRKPELTVGMTTETENVRELFGKRLVEAIMGEKIEEREYDTYKPTAAPLPSWAPQDQAHNNNYSTGYKQLDDLWGYTQGNPISEMSKRAPARDVNTPQLERTKASPEVAKRSSGNEYLNRLVNSTAKNPQTEVSKALRAKGE